MKLIIVDLDGTLFDTKDINYRAYRDAVSAYGYTIDYQYYCDFCNGRHYLDFLPQITTNDRGILSEMHNAKKEAYRKYLSYAKPNVHLINLIRLARIEYKTALVTTASAANCFDILDTFGLNNMFDLVLTREDIKCSKPDPEGFIKAMRHFDAAPEETVVFEDSDVGIEAAQKSGAYYYKTYRYN